MKKVIYSINPIFILTTIILLSCEKKIASEKDHQSSISYEDYQNESNNTINEKAIGSSTCSISCFWGSCSVSCKGGKNGNVSLANCICIGIGPLGILGSTASCSCGNLGVSVGKSIHVGEEIIFDNINIENFVKLRLSLNEIDNYKINKAKTSLDELIINAKNENASIRAIKFNKFLDDIYEIEFSDAQTIRSTLEQIASECGRAL